MTPKRYWVPWNSYYFHASFACSFVWILNLSRKYLVPEVYDWKKFGREFLCVFLAGTLAFWVSLLAIIRMFDLKTTDSVKTHIRLGRHNSVLVALPSFARLFRRSLRTHLNHLFVFLHASCLDRRSKQQTSGESKAKSLLV